MFLASVSTQMRMNVFYTLIFRHSSILSKKYPLTLLYPQDAMDALNGRSYDGRDLRITVDAGRPAGGGGGGRG